MISAPAVPDYPALDSSEMNQGPAFPQTSIMCTYCSVEGRGQILPMLWRDTPALRLASWCGEPEGIKSGHPWYWFRGPWRHSVSSVTSGVHTFHPSWDSTTISTKQQHVCLCLHNVMVLLCHEHFKNCRWIGTGVLCTWGGATPSRHGAATVLSNNQVSIQHWDTVTWPLVTFTWPSFPPLHVGA